MAIKKEIAHKRLNKRTAIQAMALQVYMTGNLFNISSTNRSGGKGRYERSP